MQPVELIVLQYLYVTAFVGILPFYITVLFNIEERELGIKVYSFLVHSLHLKKHS